MLATAKKLAPVAVRRLARGVKVFLTERWEANMTPREAFTRVYLQDLWSDGSPDERTSRFYSGPGSDSAVAQPYAARVHEFIAEHDIRSVVDLGCGDFRVGSLIARPGLSYIGVDVVEPLIEEHKRRHGGPEVEFRCLDMIADELPDGELCLVRQVFQHLSNAQITTILGKLRKFKWIIVTEDEPGPLGSFVPNVNKGHGSESRIVKNTGIVFGAAPFNLRDVKVLLDIPAPEVTRNVFSADARLMSFLIPAQ